MKILYDYRAFQVYYQRGVGRYVHDMFACAIRKQRQPAYVLLYPDGPFPVFSPEIEGQIIYCHEQDFIDGFYEKDYFDAIVIGSCCWMNVPANEVLDTLYPEPVMQCCRIKTVVLHDFIPLLFPQCIPAEDSKVSYALQMEAIKYLDHIFVNSFFTQYSGMRYLDRPAELFTCLYGGANEAIFTSCNSAAAYDATKRKNHLVYISGAAPQKNNEGFVRAFCKAYGKGILPQDACLYIVCKADEAYIEQVRGWTKSERCMYGRQVIATGFIPDEELVALLASARAGIFPSFYEGLGLPILESYMAGTPCWASSVSATKEFVLPACSFDPFDQEAMMHAAGEIFRNPKLCEESLAFGRALIKTVNWDTGAGKMLETLRALTANQ